MKKLKLDSDDLKVESFVADETETGRGTVVAHTGSGTCNDTGCMSGLTAYCGTAAYTDCPGASECGNLTFGYTCANTCTDYGCTGCGWVC